MLAIYSLNDKGEYKKTFPCDGYAKAYPDYISALKAMMRNFWGISQLIDYYGHYLDLNEIQFLHKVSKYTKPISIFNSNV